MKNVRNRSKDSNPILIVVVTITVLIYWVWLFYTTQPATVSNTYKQQEKIINIEVRLASHRGSDKLYIFSNNRCFMLDTGWQNREKTYKLAEHILSDKTPLSITIWEHIPRSVFSTNTGHFKVHQVVDLRSDGEVYWDITNHNNYQKREQFVGIVAGIVISSVAVVFILAVYWGLQKK